MTSAFFRKMRGDLASLSGRLALLSFAVGIGVLALSAIAGTASTLLREMERSYEDTFPATATLEFERPVDAAWAEGLRGSRGIVDARAGGTFQVRFLDGDGRWQPLVLFVVPDLAANRIAVVTPEAGTVWPPRPGNLALERTAVSTFKLRPGEAVSLRLSDGSERSSRLESVVHDPGVAPAYQERTAYAYVDAETAAGWGLEPFNQLKVRFDQSLSWAASRKAALGLAEELAAAGWRTHDIQVPPVHRHPHQGILMALLAVLAAFGVLTIVLCSLLVANTVAALMAKEKRWIGVMRTLGASSPRILVLTLAPVVVLALAAVSWSVPTGLLVSRTLSATIADLLNISLRNPAVEWWAVLVPLAAGLFAPIAISAVPARAAQRVTILQALSDVGTEAQRFSAPRSPWARAVLRLSPALGLAWRNALRKKRRLALSLLLLGIGGGLFITAFNLGASWRAVLAESFAARGMDFQVRLIAEAPDGFIDDLRQRVEEIEAAEFWESVSAATVGSGEIPVEATYPDEAHGSFRAFAVEAPTSMVDFPLIEGRWPARPGEIVLNQSAALRFPDAAVGDRVSVLLAGVERRFTLVGVVRELGQAAAYLERSALRGLEDRSEFRRELLVSLSPGADPDRAERKLEAALAELHLPVEVLIDNREFVLAGGEHFELLIGVILALGLVTGIVGWLGIASLLALAVTERRREFGIIRTIGGTPTGLLAAIMAEAATMTVLGTLTAVLLSLPIAVGLGAYLGNLSARMPLPLVVDVPMAALWLALSLPAGILASLGAGFRASRIVIRETLHYQ